MATTAAPTTAPETVPEEAAPKSKKKLFLIIFLILAILGGGGAGAWFFHFKPAEAQEVKAEELKNAAAATPPVFVVLDPFTVNLQPDGQFLQASFTLQMESMEDSQALKNFLPQVRSRLLLLLSSSQANELATPEGKMKLQREIIESVETPFNAGLKPVNVLDVFITSFVIQ
jgi:flagellar FliL protein